MFSSRSRRSVSTPVLYSPSGRKPRLDSDSRTLSRSILPAVNAVISATALVSSATMSLLRNPYCDDRDVVPRRARHRQPAQPVDERARVARAPAFEVDFLVGDLLVE